MNNETAKPDDEIVVNLNETDVDAAEGVNQEAAPLEQGVTGEDNPLEAKLHAAEAEAADLKDKLLRTLAEAENIRKRADRQVSEARVFAIESFARDLLDVSDNLARALQALPAEARTALSPEGQSLCEGVEMTEKSLHTVLARHGVKAIDAAPGAAFDPNVHQAVSQIPSDEPSGTVAMPFQSGWKIGERTLRAAMVAVSTGPASLPDEDT